MSRGDASPVRTFRFSTDRLALDLLATVGGRGAGRNIEKLLTTEQLARWLLEAGIVDEPPSDVAEIDLRAARSLREAIYRLVCARLDGCEGDPVDAAIVNAAAAIPRPVPILLPGAERVRRVPSSQAQAVASCLAAVACDAIELLGSDLIDRVRHCANPVCTALFLDMSRPGRRRWCSMGDGGCGNRAKTSAIRARRRESPQQR